MIQERLSIKLAIQILVLINVVKTLENTDWVVVVSVSEWYDEIFHDIHQNFRAYAFPLAYSL